MMLDLSEKTYWYLASPYSKYPHGLDAAYELAVRACGLLMQHGISVYSPIVHTHPIASMCQMDPRDLEIWLPIDGPMIAASHGMIALMAESWAQSEGMLKEREACEAAGKPIVYMVPGEFPLAFVP